ncbi:aldehyde ferredoxin oxidoreductase C-terminal domain-containing protein [Nonomuraea turcica]|uniref:aldehyde ferredoxin oxidoreductase C-terminal domain-containing protein n=1 Tax=Nonomuraea sp. G32 TaxID=3067274 RepID=UPI00273A8AFC|nr:aldehyde ferredoxin oxidoreductase C-terminal domain-containing protein [Nonomuraea sp. G32]MDP4507772.1 aldehyde ferredoxin oxidoreductase C-terminal domain-containing protein [Nonomuraea sp. G32]
MPLIVDLTSGTVEREHRFGEPGHYGGSILGLRLLAERIPAGLDPFDPRALVFVAAGMLGGTRAPGLAKGVFLAKSPLTGVAGEAHALGPFAAGMRGAGVEALAVTGRAERLSYLVVRDGEVSCHEAGELRGLGTAATTDALRARHGQGAHVAAIGPAGENLVRYASVVTDYAYAAGRYGIGAVFGAKNLKAIVCVGDAPAEVADPAAVAAIDHYYRDAIAGNPLAALQAGEPGFAGWAGEPPVPGYASVRNFTLPGGLRVPGVRDYNGRAVALRGACPGCPNDCLKVYASPSADERRSGGLGQEAFLSLGWNLGIDDLDTVLDANALCNDLGLDQVSLGGTLAFAMECAERGLLPGGPAFGDAAALPGLIRDVARRAGDLGDLLAEGAARAAARLGPQTAPYAMTVKGAELPCFDPRIQPGIGLGYALAPNGPRYDALEHDLDFDPVAGLAYSFPEAARIGARPAPAGVLDAERGRRSARLLRLWSGLDALNLCVFASSPTRPLTIDRLTALVTAVHGRDFTLEDLLAAGQRRLDELRAYAAREGMGGRDQLPARMHDEPVAEGPYKGAVLDREAFARARDAFYDELGWR